MSPKWDWLRQPAAQPDAAPSLSPAALRGLVLARACEQYGLSPRQLGLRTATLVGRWRLSPRDVCRLITIARIQVRRAETPRLCAACERPLVPRQRAGTRYCRPACRQRSYETRLRERNLLRGEG